MGHRLAFACTRQTPHRFKQSTLNALNDALNAFIRSRVRMMPWPLNVLKSAQNLVVWAQYFTSEHPLWQFASKFSFIKLYQATVSLWVFVCIILYLFAVFRLLLPGSRGSCFHHFSSTATQPSHAAMLLQILETSCIQFRFYGACCIASYLLPSTSPNLGVLLVSLFVFLALLAQTKVLLSSQLLFWCLSGATSVPNNLKWSEPRPLRVLTYFSTS